MQEFIVKDLFHYCNILTKAASPARARLIDFWDLTFVMNGSMTYIVNGKRYAMRKNDAIFLPPGCERARLEGEEPVRYASFNFSLAEGVELPFPEFMKGCITNDIKSLVNVFPQSHLYPNYHSKEKLASLLNYILFELLDVTAEYSANEHVAKIIRLVDLNLTKKLSLSHISREVGLAKEYVASIFKRETGKTLTEYINERKLLYAKELIVTSQMSISDTALHLGYDNYTYFSRLFKRYFGFSPKQLLSQQQAK